MFAFNSMSTRSFECITDTHPVRSIALHPSGGAFLPWCGTVLVADAHFGKAVSFRRLGVPVPQGTTSETLGQLTALVRDTRAQRIVFLGDFLHSARSHAASRRRGLRLPFAAGASR
mgnify:CR=1 FL=1